MKNQAIEAVKLAVATLSPQEAEVLAGHIGWVVENLDDGSDPKTLLHIVYNTIIRFYSDMVFWFSPGLALEAAFTRCVRATDSLVQFAERHGIPHTMPV